MTFDCFFIIIWVHKIWFFTWSFLLICRLLAKVKTGEGLLRDFLHHLYILNWRILTFRVTWLILFEIKRSEEVLCFFETISLKRVIHVTELWEAKSRLLLLIGFIIENIFNCLGACYVLELRKFYARLYVSITKIYSKDYTFSDLLWIGTYRFIINFFHSSFLFLVWWTLGYLKLFTARRFEQCQNIINPSITLPTFMSWSLEGIRSSQIVALKWARGIFMNRFSIEWILAMFRCLTVLWSLLKRVLLKWIGRWLKRVIVGLKRIFFALNTGCLKWIRSIFISIWFLLLCYFPEITRLKLFIALLFIAILENSGSLKNVAWKWIRIYIFLNWISLWFFLWLLISKCICERIIKIYRSSWVCVEFVLHSITTQLRILIFYESRKAFW